MQVLNEYKVYDDNFDLDKALKEGGYYDKDNRWNSLMKKGNKLYRVRVETLIINSNGNIFLRLNNNDYRVPGGSIERGKSYIDQAIIECNQEAFIHVKNIKDSGLHYTKNNFIPKYVSKDKFPLVWDGNYTYIFVAEYDRKYDGNVDIVDKDNDMYKNGRFYTYMEVRDVLIKEHILAYEKYIKESDINYHNTIYYPYYTPHQMQLIGVYNEDVYDNCYKTNASKNNIKWFKQYSETYDPGEEWVDLVKETYLEFMKSDTPENRQTLLELGWNPDINFFNADTLYKVSTITKNILKNT